METACSLCQLIAECQAGESPFLVREFPHCVLVVGESQFHRGYCLLVLKEHVREMHDLPAATQQAVFSELMAATGALVSVFQPWKMNHASFGNLTPHVHWHLIPRYADDPNRTKQPWYAEDAFGQHIIDADAARALAAKIAAAFPAMPD